MCVYEYIHVYMYIYIHTHNVYIHVCIYVACIRIYIYIVYVYKVDTFRASGLHFVVCSVFFFTDVSVKGGCHASSAAAGTRLGQFGKLFGCFPKLWALFWSAYNNKGHGILCISLEAPCFGKTLISPSSSLLRLQAPGTKIFKHRPLASELRPRYGGTHGSM